MSSTKFRTTASLFHAALAVALLSAGAGAAQAGEWTWSVTPYAWGTDLGVDVELDGRTVFDESIPVTDLLKDLDMIFQGRIEAMSGSHGFMIDVFYAAMSDEVGGLALPQGAGEAAIDWDMDLTIADVAGTYDPNGAAPGLSFLYGARIIHEYGGAGARFTTATGQAQQDYESSDTLVDMLAGVRFSRPLSRRLACEMQADLSTGGTSFTWSAYPSLLWRFGGGRALTAGYRTMTVDFESEDGLDSKMTLSGPVLGFRMSF